MLPLQMAKLRIENWVDNYGVFENTEKNSEKIA